jgi:hypothetical protein
MKIAVGCVSGMNLLELETASTADRGMSLLVYSVMTHKPWHCGKRVGSKTRRRCVQTPARLPCAHYLHIYIYVYIMIPPSAWGLEGVFTGVGRNRVARTSYAEQRVTWRSMLMNPPPPPPDFQIAEKLYIFGLQTCAQRLGSWCCQLATRLSDQSTAFLYHFLKFAAFEHLFHLHAIIFNHV